MAQILGRYGLAREDGYFKHEQEADIQELRKRLIEQGRFTEDYLGPDAMKALGQSTDDVSPVLMEVLQASARMDVPNAARHRIWELRKRAGLPPLSEAELAKAVRQLRLGSAALLVPSELSLSTRHGWRSARAAAHSSAVGALPPPLSPSRTSAAYAATGSHAVEHPAAMTRSALSPEQQALANRQAAIVLRSAAYGTMAGVAVLGLGATAFAASCGVWSLQDARGALKRWGQSWREPIREVVMPWANWARSWTRRRE